MGRQNLLRHLSRFPRRSASPIVSGLILLQNPTSSSPSRNEFSGPRFGGSFSSPRAPTFLAFSNFASFRSFSQSVSTENPDDEFNELFEDPVSELEPLNIGLELGEEGGSQLNWYSPVRAVISLLDGYHDLTSFPWWVIIATSTLGLRMALLPVLILQLKKLQRMSELMPKLPPPFPPPLSGKSFKEQFLLFRKEKRAIGCPSFLWTLASFLVQLPCFILWMTSIRRMSLDHHPGFDTGGALWFQNLTEFPHGLLAPVFPVLIAILHFTNVQISFQKSTIRSFPGIIGKLARYYKRYLDILSIPILLIGFCVPQGSLVYWLTNSSLNAVQQLSMRHPFIRSKLGLHADYAPTNQKIVKARIPPEKPFHPLSLKHPSIFQKLGIQPDSLALDHNMPAENLPPVEMLGLGLRNLAAGNHDKALPLLQLASDKDPELEDRASLAIGLFFLSRGSHMEAAEYFLRAISKIKDDEISQLVIASYGAGFSLIQQGRKLEGIEYLKRIADLKEPENLEDKFCYYQGLVILGSALFNEGQKAEALKYLHIAAVFDPAVNKYIEECEKAED